jgi:hypothetical protein
MGQEQDAALLGAIIISIVFNGACGVRGGGWAVLKQG